MFNPEELGQNFVKWRKELLTIPTRKFKDAFGNLFQIHTGVRYKEKVGYLTGDMQIGPYDPMRVDTTDVTVTARELEVFLGSVVKQIDPNTAIQTIWDEYVAKGAQGANIPFVKFVAAYLMGKMSENLYMHVWDGKRNPSGTETVDLCDGIETIINKEIKAGNIATDNGNLIAIEAITDSNAEDVFKSVFRQLDPKLRDRQLNLVCSFDEYWKYCDAYQANHGALPYNQKFDQPVLEGTMGRVKIKPVENVANNFIKIVPDHNFVFGTNIDGEETKMLIEKSKKSHFMYDLVATLFAGYQIERIEKEFMCVAASEAVINAAKA